MKLYSDNVKENVDKPQVYRFLQWVSATVSGCAAHSFNALLDHWHFFSEKTWKPTGYYLLEPNSRKTLLKNN